MTTSEMIAFCENGADWYNRIGPTAEKFEAIAAKLRAAEELAEVTQGISNQMYENTQLEQALKKYHAAGETK